MTTTKKLLITAVALMGMLACAALGSGWVGARRDQIWTGLDVVFAVLVVSLVMAVLVIVLSLIVESITRLRSSSIRLRQALAEAQSAEREASYSVIRADAGEQLYIADGQSGRVWHAMHRDPRVYGAGGWTEPSRTEIASYLAWLEAQRRRSLPAGEGAAADLAAASARPLLDYLQDLERGLVVGPPGSGKTTILQHIIDTRPGDVVVIDPHDDQHTWPETAQVVGGGQDYPAIESALAQMADLVRDRYQQRSAGQAQFPPVILILDEWYEIFQELPGAATYVKKILTGGRKVSSGVLIGSHSERVGPLGIRGEGDLKASYTVIRLRGDRANGFSGTIDLGDGEMPIALPGPYLPGVVRGQLEPGQPVIDPDHRVLDAREAFILERHRAGDTPSQIGESLYGQRGGWQSDRVREVLAKHNLQPNE